MNVSWPGLMVSVAHNYRTVEKSPEIIPTSLLDFNDQKAHNHTLSLVADKN